MRIDGEHLPKYWHSHSRWITRSSTRKIRNGKPPGPFVFERVLRSSFSLPFSDGSVWLSSVTMCTCSDRNGSLVGSYFISAPSPSSLPPPRSKVPPLNDNITSTCGFMWTNPDHEGDCQPAIMPAVKSFAPFVTFFSRGTKNSVAVHLRHVSVNVVALFSDSLMRTSSQCTFMAIFPWICISEIFDSVAVTREEK